MTQEELKKRTKAFAVRVFNLVDTFPQKKASDVIAYQILKLSSSVAANYRAVCRAKSDADFFNKLKIVDEEADETLYWLEMITDVNLQCNKDELQLLLKEADELVSIFSASIRTLRNKKINSEHGRGFINPKILNPNIPQ